MVEPTVIENTAKPKYCEICGQNSWVCYYQDYALVGICNGCTHVQELYDG